MERLAEKEDVENILAVVEETFQKHGITEEERDTIWQGIAAFCLYQLEEKKGPFYESAKELLKD